MNEVLVPELVRTLNGKCTTRSATRELMQSSNYVVMGVCEPLNGLFVLPSNTQIRAKVATSLWNGCTWL